MLTCQTFNLIPISSTTGSAVISLLLMLPKPDSWSFQTRRIHSLMFPCTSTINRLSRFHYLNLLWFLVSNESSGWSYLLKKARTTIGYIHRAFVSAPIITRRILYLNYKPLKSTSFTTDSIMFQVDALLEVLCRSICVKPSIRDIYEIPQFTQVNADFKCFK